MKKILGYLPLHFVISIILGIVLQFYIKICHFSFTKIGVLLSVLLGFILLLNNRIIRTVLAFVFFFFLGIFSVFVNNDLNYENYYQKQLTSTSTAILKIDKVLKSSLYHHKFEAEVLQIDSLKTRGRVLLNLSKDSVAKPFKVDELLYVKSPFKAINKPLNPHQFDYRFYLAKQGIHQQLFISKNNFIRLGFKPFSLVGLSAKFRTKIQESLQKYQFKNDELAVINALLLGQRQEISKELLANYSKAGAIHILAVSGLHVGIILLILTWLLKPLERLKKGKFIKIICIVLFLWMFAFIAGLSASVTRAVTMFTFLAIGMSFNQKNVSVFSLISSMFLLLIFKPMFLFDVGFQMSYLAVFGIILIQPKLYIIYKPRFIVDEKIWQLASVSIAAQIGVLPLSLFYFHQFPGLFMLSNLIIIPFLGAILVAGILVIFLALIGVLPQFLANCYGYVISVMNSFVSWISHQEQFLFKEISLSFFMMLATYTATFIGVLFLMKKSPKRLIYFLSSILVIQSVFLVHKHQKKTKEEFIVFHKSRNSILGNRVGEQVEIHHDLDSINIQNLGLLSSYRIGENIHQTLNNDVSNIYQFKNEIILVVDSLGIYQLNDLKNPIVLLQQSPKINLERLIMQLKPKQIIADGSNYKSYVKRWQQTAENKKTPFHDTAKKGAYILSN
ncbi:competence protein [Polaribacter reichenbachii]|uniref:Competence protein n=1 Tax=Polaribacter reichenbachii TaxID=996801 RepID=A0A1B8TSD9_9FLAO|nr:ComEC/Rec2 family competence protein [Polaribacter reichenbachii]APZ44912.1 competence protein [Polaribacter reichenbachii]AUC18776.1 competence protein [Polaribacter reichenbachii]OBY62394.1 competence protein [Polaribacter reichenbachii]